MILRFVHIAIVCLLGLGLAGVPRLVAADECVSACMDLHVEVDDRGADRSAATSCDMYRAMNFSIHASCPALPQQAELPPVTRLSLRWSMEGTGAPCIGTPREVFQPPRQG